MRLAKLIDAETCEYKWKKIEKIKEFDALKRCEQSPRWHKEGNAWNHTVAVCNEAIKVAKEMVNEEDRLVFLLLSSTTLVRGLPLRLVRMVTGTPTDMSSRVRK